jgi:hypothetical protein
MHLHIFVMQPRLAPQKLHARYCWMQMQNKYYISLLRLHSLSLSLLEAFSRKMLQQTER